MDFKLFKVSGYEESIMSLRMSKGKFYSWEAARDIQQLVYVCTDERGFVASEKEHDLKLTALNSNRIVGNKITGDYERDVAEFKRLLQLTFENAMQKQTHHTLMKYIDISFITEGLHRGAQDDLDAHAIAFNNRITRYSTRLAEIDEVTLSEWYEDKVIPFSMAFDIIGADMPERIETEAGVFCYTPFGYMLEQYAAISSKNGLHKDVKRGLIGLGTPGPALWKTDIFNLRYVYHMRSKLTKANPELKMGMEQLADEIEKRIPVFGPYFRKVFTSSGQWEHTNKVKTITADEYELFQKLKKGAGLV